MLRHCRIASASAEMTEHFPPQTRRSGNDGTLSPEIQASKKQHFNLRFKTPELGVIFEV